MNIDNLEIGQVFNKYEDLCNFLSIKKKGGKSKELQMKELQRFIKLTKDGHKLIVDEIYDEPLEKEQKERKVRPYVKPMESLFMHLLLKENQNKMIVSMSDLAKRLQMIHSNYNELYSNKGKLSEELGVEVGHIYDFIGTTNSAYKYAIESMLNNLENKNAIMYKETIMIMLEDEFSKKQELKEANDYEINEIIKAKRIVMKKYGKSEQEIYNKGLGKKYEDELNTVLYSLLSIVYHYKAWSIFAPENFLREEYEESLLKNDVTEAELEYMINSSWSEYHNKRFENKHLKASEKSMFDGFNFLSKSERLRADENYPSKMNILTDKYVRKNLSPNIPTHFNI